MNKMGLSVLNYILTHIVILFSFVKYYKDILSVHL